MHIPLISEDLIKRLDTTYPHRCPLPSEDERKIWMYAGRRALVDDLLLWTRDQQEAGIDSNILNL